MPALLRRFSEAEPDNLTALESDYPPPYFTYPLRGERPRNGSHLAGCARTAVNDCFLVLDFFYSRPH